MSRHQDRVGDSTESSASVVREQATGRQVRVAPAFPILDTLRFVGALSVVTTHTSFQAGAYTRHGLWGALLSRLDVGVAIFFVISGFLLFRPHVVAALAGRAGPPPGRYYWKRLLRIYPVYFVTVLLALGLISDNRGESPWGWLRTLLLLDSFVSPRLPQGLTQMWSLAVEVCFYLLLPVLAAAAFGRGIKRLHLSRFVALLVGMVAVSVGWHLRWGPDLTRHTAGSPMTWLPSYLTWFAVGMSLAFVHARLEGGHRDRLSRYLQALGSAPGACWVIIAGLMLAAATPLGGPTLLFVPTAAESLTKHLLYAAIGGLVVITGVFPSADSRYAAVMSHRFLRHLGHISYSTFCLHLPVLHLVMSVGAYELFRGHGLEIWVLTVGASLIASELAFRLIEMPAQRLRNISLRGLRRGSHPTANAHATTTKY